MDKSDKQEILEAISALAGNFGGRMDRLEADLGGKMVKLEADLGGRMDRLEADLGGKMDRLETRIDGIETEVSGLRADVADVKAGQARVSADIKQSQQAIAENYFRTGGRIDQVASMLSVHMASNHKQSA